MTGLAAIFKHLRCVLLGRSIPKVRRSYCLDVIPNRNPNVQLSFNNLQDLELLCRRGSCHWMLCCHTRALLNTSTKRKLQNICGGRMTYVQHFVSISRQRLYVRNYSPDVDTSLICALGNGEPYEVSRSNLRDLYWTPYQQLTHLASAGCGMTSGDLVGTGTISGEVILREEVEIILSNSLHRDRGLEGACSRLPKMARSPLP